MLFRSGKDAKAKEEKEKAEAKLSLRAAKGGKARRMKQQWAGADESSSGGSVAANDTNDDSNPYFRATLDCALRQLGAKGSAGSTTSRCLSLARHASGSSKSPSPSQIIPGSGATSHMRRHKDAFEVGSYAKCASSFVPTGGGTPTPA